MTAIPLSQVVRWIEPGPLVLLTTSYENEPNVMAMGFHMMVQHDPPLLAVVVGPWDHSYKALVETKECVIAIPGTDLMATAVDIGNCSGADVDKFERFGLTAMTAQSVGAPLIGECLANIECKVIDMKLVKEYNVFLMEAVQAWQNEANKGQRIFHHQGNGTFTADGDITDLRSRMTKWKDIVNDE